jgi:hypothetical protein
VLLSCSTGSGRFQMALFMSGLWGSWQLVPSLYDPNGLASRLPHTGPEGFRRTKAKVQGHLEPRPCYFCHVLLINVNHKTSPELGQGKINIHFFLGGWEQLPCFSNLSKLGNR